MSNSPICDDPLLNNEVIIMEDKPSTQATIKETLEKDLKWKVTVANNQEEAVRLFEERRAAYFILDNGIGDNPQEGIDALEKIKNIDETAFVAILSIRPNAKEMVSKLKGNLFELKTDDLKSNVHHIALEILKYRLEIIDKLQEDLSTMRGNIVSRIKFIEHLETNFCSTITSDETVTTEQVYYGTKDPNIIAYESLKSDPDWFNKHQGQYVAFVDGEFKFSYPDRQEFFKKLTESEEYKGKKRFFKKVEVQERIIEVSSSVEQLLNEKL